MSPELLTDLLGATLFLGAILFLCFMGLVGLEIIKLWYGIGIRRKS